MDTEICTKLFEQLFSGNNLAQIVSALFGAIIGGAISWRTALSVLNKTQTNERRIRLYSLVTEVNIHAEEMFNASYILAGKINKNKSNLDNEEILEELYDLANKFWAASYTCRNIIDRNFPELKQSFDTFQENLKVFPMFMNGVSLNGLLTKRFEEKYNFETLNCLAESKTLFINKQLAEHPRAKEAFSAMYGA